MEHKLPPLPWPEDALAPHISAETIQYHYGKHHKAYVDKLNGLIPGTPLESATLEEIILKMDGGIFNNAAQIWNHTFYWNCLSPNGGKEPTGPLATAIEKRWSSFEEFKNQFSKSAIGNFGSGWTWLVTDASREVSIVNTDDADCPIRKGLTPLLTLDVWEHAYYIDYRNSRPQYIEAFWKIANWDFASSNYQN